jgi:hypothetical protein
MCANDSVVGQVEPWQGASQSERFTVRVTTIIAEFNSLRAEIAGRTASQQMLVNLNLTMVGLVLGIAFSQNANAEIILVIPIFASCCAMLYFDHAAQIAKVGQYIAQVLHPELVTLAGDRNLLAWEAKHLTFRRESETALFQFGIPTFVLFVGGPLSICVAGIAVIDELLLWLAWALGLALELTSGYLWVLFIRKNRPDSKLVQGASMMTLGEA